MDKTLLIIVIEVQKHTVKLTHVVATMSDQGNMILVVSQPCVFQSYLFHFASVWVGKRLQTCSWEEGVTEWRKLFTGTEQGG